MMSGTKTYYSKFITDKYTIFISQLGDKIRKRGKKDRNNLFHLYNNLLHSVR